MGLRGPSIDGVLLADAVLPRERRRALRPLVAARLRPVRDYPSLRVAHRFLYAASGARICESEGLTCHLMRSRYGEPRSVPAIRIRQWRVSSGSGAVTMLGPP